MVLPIRFELTAYRLGGGRSIQLSYESSLDTLAKNSIFVNKKMADDD